MNIPTDCRLLACGLPTSPDLVVLLALSLILWAGMKLHAKAPKAQRSLKAMPAAP